MFKNYFKIIGRNLWKNKLYTLINIIGLGVGIASIVWAFQNYRYSYSFNNFHKDSKDIFRVLSKTRGSDNLKGICPMPLAVMAKNDFSAIKKSVRWDSRGLDIKSDQSEPFASEANFTDPAFFDIFNFSLLEGTINLNDRSTVVITEKAAKKFFGNTNPIGKTLLFYSDESYKKPLTVSGVLKDPPHNSSLQFEVVTNFENEYKPDGTIIKDNDWSWFVDAVFVKLSEPSDATKISADFNKYLPLQREASQDLQLTSFVMEPLSKVADNSIIVENNALWQMPPDSETYGTLILGILILLSACLNFANTSVALSNQRLKEMGVRKVMGSLQSQIVMQQMLECACIVFAAVILSVVINNFWLPVFNTMFVFVHVSAHYFSDYTLLAFMAIVMIAVTLLAGAYPAFYISRFNATKIFRGSIKFGGRNLFSRLLLGLQIVISFITVIAGIAFSRNSEFQRTYDYGFDKENIIGLNLQNEEAYAPARDELSRIPGIDKMTGTKDQIGFSYHNVILEAQGEQRRCEYMETGASYLDVMSLKLVAGRAFNTSGKGDYAQSMLINEKLSFDFGWKPEEAIGKQIRKNDSTVCTVVGVLKDFTQNTLFDPIGPVAMCLVPPEQYSQIIIHAKPGELNTVYEKVKAAWSKLYPMKPFRGYYQDQVAAQASSVNKSVATIFFWFAIISVLLAATGMFALVSLSILKKMREIAIRKVVGAGGGHIFRLVLKGYFWIFLVGAGIGCYAGYTLSKLLMDMIFRINAGVSMSSLIDSFICVFVISVVTISSKVWHAVHTKATDVLKSN